MHTGETDHARTRAFWILAIAVLLTGLILALATVLLMREVRQTRCEMDVTACRPELKIPLPEDAVVLRSSIGTNLAGDPRQGVPSNWVVEATMTWQAFVAYYETVGTTRGWTITSPDTNESLLIETGRGVRAHLTRRSTGQNRPLRVLIVQEGAS